MTRTILILSALALPATGCAKEPLRKRAATTQPTGSVRTPEEAVKIVQRHIRESGGDPTREEITAEWSRGQWRVIAWRIVYPNNTGASRFVPGGHQYYMVSPDGGVTKLMPGA